MGLQLEKKMYKAVCIREFYSELSFIYTADILNKAYALLITEHEREKGSWRRIEVGVTYTYGEGCQGIRSVVWSKIQRISLV